jgi:hypothetical protein
MYQHGVGTYCRLLYPVMVTLGCRLQAVRSWTQWALKPYTDQGACQDGVVHMFCVSLVDKSPILIVLYFDM